VTRRCYAYLAVLACAAVLWLPALGQASSGGGGMSGNARSSGSAGTSAQPANAPVSASGNGVTITTRAGALLRNGLQFTGSAPSSDAGKLIEIERFGAKTGWTWQSTVQARVGSDGSFAAVWRTNHIGRFSIRAVIQQPGGTAASASGGWPAVTVVVYRPSIATLYGPGFYGQKTACGVTLRRNTIGLANRTLPCGTPVAVEYNGKTITVPVIDRGPYANGADWDLTMATGQTLGMDTTATIGAVSLPRRG
jgi:rare lipoprotein A